MLLSSLVVAALAADANAPHPHQGVLPAYTGAPPEVPLTAEDLDRLEVEAVERGLLDPAQTAVPAKRRPEPEKRLPYRVFHSQKGAEIRVGRSARDNDELSIRHCRGKDMWLHTADSPGSHVVLFVRDGIEPPKDVIEAAAAVAALQGIEVSTLAEQRTAVIELRVERTRLQLLQLVLEHLHGLGVNVRRDRNCRVFQFDRVWAAARPVARTDSETAVTAAIAPCFRAFMFLPPRGFQQTGFPPCVCRRDLHAAAIINKGTLQYPSCDVNTDLITNRMTDYISLLAH